MLILDPKLSQEENKNLLETIKKILADYEAKIIKEDIWGDKKLAYKIRSSTRGFYALFDIEMNGNHIKDITKKMNLETAIWRFMFTKKED